MVKSLPTMQETGFDPWVWKIPLDKGMAMHSSLENSMDRGAGGLQSIGLQRVRHNWATNTHTHMGTPRTQSSWWIKLTIIPFKTGQEGRFCLPLLGKVSDFALLAKVSDFALLASSQVVSLPSSQRLSKTRASWVRHRDGMTHGTADVKKYLWNEQMVACTPGLSYIPRKWQSPRSLGGARAPRCQLKR